MNKEAAAIVKVIERVQQQMTAARMVGKIATQYGSRQISKTIRQVMAAVTDLAVKPQSHQPNRSSAMTERIAVEVPNETTIDYGSDLAIANYQTLSALHIVAQLEFLCADELRAIADFEKTHRMRRTVLFKIDQLLQT